MPDTAVQPVYLVDAYSDPAVVRVNGRACFQNSACLREFVTEMLRQQKTRFVFDFQNCSSMDSTFLGVLAGIALELKKVPGGGSLVLARMGPRNLELVRNLGLHRLLTVETGDFPMTFDAQATPIPCRDQTELDHARLVLEAHENLVTADESNRAKFQDVLAFLKNRVQQG
ncbi:STAS domain-containing protein [Opitutus terrae]|uniref:Anti-sigma-factor antagonist n=1 Tax=Opitutus terrae (strain DSM 11246 / JCM 15787 / PB90-1) TaxID=452637 RepID=B1ZUZ7_OPITP|nr:STAS domain-containing protein [Opitutus terrae]ACB75967.1 anti-sigma-factor antagonist [Opitutus terrae PB90-1]